MSDSEGLQGSELIAVALDLLRIAERKRSDAHLRRAISAAYYAVFHCLARIAADRLVQPTGRPGYGHAWYHVYRSLQHRHARKQCLNAAILPAYSMAIRRFAACFAELQEQRHQADYNPAAAFEPAEVDTSVRTAAGRIREFERATEAEQRAFAAWVLLAARRG